eukprot:5871479-Amphidinium_carterae.1
MATRTSPHGQQKRRETNIHVFGPTTTASSQDSTQDSRRKSTVARLLRFVASFLNQSRMRSIGNGGSICSLSITNTCRERTKTLAPMTSIGQPIRRFMGVLARSPFVPKLVTIVIDSLFSWQSITCLLMGHRV